MTARRKGRLHPSDASKSGATLGKPVLVDGVGGRLVCHRVLELAGDHRDAVEEQDEVQLLALLLRIVVYLADDGERVGPVVRLDLRVEPVRRSEGGDANRWIRRT